MFCNTFIQISCGTLSGRKQRSIDIITTNKMKTNTNKAQRAEAYQNAAILILIALMPLVIVGLNKLGVSLY
jgi:hypothetical protein